MGEDRGAISPGARAFNDAIAFAVERTGTSQDCLDRDAFLQAAALAEESGDLRMTQRLLVLADDEEMRHNES